MQESLHIKWIIAYTFLLFLHKDRNDAIETMNSHREFRLGRCTHHKKRLWRYFSAANGKSISKSNNGDFDGTSNNSEYRTYNFSIHHPTNSWKFICQTENPNMATNHSNITNEVQLHQLKPFCVSTFFSFFSSITIKRNKIINFYWFKFWWWKFSLRNWAYNLSTISSHKLSQFWNLLWKFECIILCFM